MYLFGTYFKLLWKKYYNVIFKKYQCFHLQSKYLLYWAIKEVPSTAQVSLVPAVVGESCGSSSGYSVPWTHSGTARAGLELYWPRAPQWPGWGSLESPRTDSLAWLLALQCWWGFLRVTVLVHSLKSSHREQMFCKLTPSYSQQVHLWDGRSWLIPPLHSPSCSVYWGWEPRCWSSGHVLLDTSTQSCIKCLPVRLPVTADLCWFTAAEWQWRRLC